VPLVHPALLGLTTRHIDPRGAAGLAGAPAAVEEAGRRGLVELVADGSLAADVLRDEGAPLDLDSLVRLAGGLAAREPLWRPLVRHDPEKRWYTRLLLTGVVEVWLIGWAPGQHTAVHDHGGALGALAVADGAVEEDIHTARGGAWEPGPTRRYSRGRAVGFAAEHVHRVINRTALPATTVHAYSPPEVPLRYAAQAGSVTVPSDPGSLLRTDRVPAAAAAAR